MKKDYFDQEAYNYIENKLNETKINSVFKPIVIDIILRRRHEYQLDDKYFHRDVESFINNVKEIYLKNVPGNIGGRFDPQKKCIIINENKFKEYMHDDQGMELLLKIICHECVHAMNYDETGKDRSFPKSKGMCEVFTEKEAARIVPNRDLEDTLKIPTPYANITKYVEAIAAAFGVKEKEQLAAAIKGRQELFELLNLNIKDENFSKNIYEDIELKVDSVFKEFYKDGKGVEQNLYTMNFEEIWNSLNDIYRDMEQILAYRIENLEWDNQEDLQEKLEDIKLSQNVVSNVNEGPILEALVEVKGKELVAMYEKTMVYTKVMCIEEIIKSQDENSRELISFVQSSKSVDEILEFMKQNGIEINTVNIALMPEFELSRQKR